MKKIRKRIDLAVAALTVLYLSSETIQSVIDLLSKVVNYAGRIRKFPLFIQAER